MSQHLGLTDDNRVDHIVGYIDPPGMVGPPAPPPPDTDQYTYVQWDEPVMLASSTPTQVLKWVDGAPVWIEMAPLDELKARKNTAINQWRAAANQSTFPYAGRLIACDPLSRSDIDGVANHISLFGTFPPDFPMAWKALDNTYVPLPDIDAFKAMYQAMAAQGSANFDRSQALKRALGSATDAAEVAAIAW